MSWRERRQSASWRSIPFWYEEIGLEGGRRGEDVEFPGRDVGYSDDTGRAMRRVQGTAWLDGGDHDLDAKALIGACEQKGRGEFVHPVLGRMTGVMRTYRVNHSRARLGWTGVDFSFVESGEAQFPGAAVLTLEAVDVSADAVQSAAAAAFAAAWSAVGETAFVVSQARLTLTSWASSVEDKSDFIARTVVGLATLPLDATDTIVDTVAAVIRSFSSIAALRAYYGTGPSDAPDTAGSDEEDLVRANQCALDRLVERYALTESCRLSAQTDWTLYDEAVAARDELAGRLAAEGATDRDLTAACADLRTALVTDIDDRVTSLARLVTVPITAPLSAIELAWRLYGDPTRCDEVVERNDPPHPAFLSGSVSVLSE